MMQFKSPFIKNLSLSLFVISLNLWISPSSSEELVEKMEATAISNPINIFASKLYEQLNQQNETGNFLFSPYCIYSALAMTYAGAAGNTAKQMQHALHFPATTVHSALAQLKQSLTTQPSLQIANALWGQQDLLYQVEFVELIEEYYHTPLKVIDFAKQTEAARQHINNWTAQQTANQITELFQPGILTPNTQLVLVNAIYFKGIWQSVFDKSQTKNLPFQLTPSEKIMTPTMYQKKKLKYLKIKDAYLVELPYQAKPASKNHGLSMVIILPKTMNGLSKIESKLKPKLNRWLQRLAGKRKVNVQLYLPRFKTEFAIELKQALQAMGMIDAFEHHQANFSGINGKNHDLALSAVVHKTFVEVNEEGTEAAAATGVAATVRSIQKRPIKFKVDHPFIFLIKENRSNTILFLGKINHPLEKGENI